MMQFWLPALLLLAFVTATLFLGSRRMPRATRLPDGGLAVFKHQLAELDNDIASGRVSAAEGEGLRNELSRRILGAARKGETPQPVYGGRGILALVAVMPFLAVLIYLQLGMPTMPDVPRAARLANAEKNGDTQALVAQVEDHLMKKPDDLQGWKLLVPIYMDTGHFADAAAAQMQIMALSGDTAELQAGVAEALTLRDKGLMPEAAITAAAAAFRLDAKHPKAQFYHALALSQQGKRVEALAAFNTLLASTPTGASWQGAVQQQIARLSGPGAAPDISDKQVAQGSAMEPAEQTVMIRSMVDGLDARLAANGDDAQGWLRLVRARTVLGERDKALAALEKARARFKAGSEELAALNALAMELKLQ